MIEMRSESDLWPQLISQAIHARVKATISNHEGGVAFAKINSHDKKGEKSTATVYFRVQTNTNEYQNFSLRKIVGSTQIYGCMKDWSRSTVENMSRSRTACGVQRR